MIPLLQRCPPLRALVAISLAAVAGCATRPPTDAQVREVLAHNPELVFKALEENPERFFEVAQKAGNRAHELQQQKAELAEKARREDQLKHPKIPDIPADRAALGRADAPITLVPIFNALTAHAAALSWKNSANTMAIASEWSFALAESSDGLETAARYFEAVALQSAELAYRFHDEVFHNQGALGLSGEPFLERTVEKVGANLVLGGGYSGPDTGTSIAVVPLAALAFDFAPLVPPPLDLQLISASQYRLSLLSDPAPFTFVRFESATNLNFPIGWGPMPDFGNPPSATGSLSGSQMFFRGVFQ